MSINDIKRRLQYVEVEGRPKHFVVTFEMSNSGKTKAEARQRLFDQIVSLGEAIRPPLNTRYDDTGIYHLD